MSNLIAFHGYNLCHSLAFCYNLYNLCFKFSQLQLIHHFRFSFFPFPTFWFSQFHLPVLWFRLLFWILTAASLSSFLSSHLYKYWCKLGGSVKVSLHPNFLLYYFAWWFLFCKNIYSLISFIFSPALESFSRKLPTSLSLCLPISFKFCFC